jgi:hypothetical protein
MSGSPKNPKPRIKVVPLTNISALMNIDAARTGPSTAASLNRAVSFGKGDVGDRALYDFQQ